jgi:hypothetical protein
MEAEANTFASIVGPETYSVWIKMLGELVPEGRTHRLAVVVGGMLTYAARLAYERYGDEPEAHPVALALAEAEEAYAVEEAEGLLALTEQLFEDAGVAHGRTSVRGEGYSIAENAVEAFIHWYDMPWE